MPPARATDRSYSHVIFLHYAHIAFAFLIVSAVSLSLNLSFFRPSVRVSLSQIHAPTLSVHLFPSIFLPPKTRPPGAHFSSINFLVQFIFIMIRTSRRTLLSYPLPPPVDPILPLPTTPPPYRLRPSVLPRPSLPPRTQKRAGFRTRVVCSAFFFVFSLSKTVS